MRRTFLSIALLCRLLRSRRGLSAVEFGLAAPFLVLLVVGVSDLGIGFYDALQVQHAAAAGAQYASVHAWSPDNITAAMKAAVTSPELASNIAMQNESEVNQAACTSGSPCQVCACPNVAGGTSDLTISATPPDAATLTCTQGAFWSTQTCSDGSKFGMYALVAVTATYTPLLPYPWTADTIKLTGLAYRRLQ